MSLKLNSPTSLWRSALHHGLWVITDQVRMSAHSGSDLHCHTTSGLLPSRAQEGQPWKDAWKATGPPEPRVLECSQGEQNVSQTAQLT